MEVVSECPLRTASLLWMPRPATWALTVVCKVTYRLTPGEAELAHPQEDPNEEDNHWNDDPDRSLYAVSDLAPRKPVCDVLLVGNAFAPGGPPAHSFTVRLAVGSVDKSVEVFGERLLLANGRVHAEAPAAQVPLRYERAAGGPGTSNPVGMRADARDERGLLALPPLQWPGTAVQDVFTDPPACFGPIAPLWPGRRAKASGTASWTADMWRSTPMPPDVDSSFFNVAPTDQQVDALRPDDVLFLENLHRDHAQLTTRLPGIVPRARIERNHRSSDLVLVPDTLWIDTDRAVATLTWRGHVHLDSARAEGRVVVGMEVQRAQRRQSLPSPGQAPGAPIHAPRLPETLLRAAAAHASAPETTVHPVLTDQPALPFAPSSPGTTPVLPSPSSNPQDKRGQFNETVFGAPDAAGIVLPFPNASVHAVSGVAPPALVTAPPELPEGSPWMVGLVAAPPPPQTLGQAAIVAQAGGTPTPPATGDLIVSKPMIAVEHVKTAAAEPAVTSSAAPNKPKVASLALLKKSPPGASLSAASASDAAAQVQTPSIASLLDPPPSPAAIALPAVAIELLWFDPAFPDAIRRHTDWTELVATLKPKPRDADFAEGPANPKRQEAKDKRDIAGVLVRARPESTEGLHVVFARAVDEDGRFEPPLAMVGGELLFPFDEIETLKATVAVIAPLAGPDDKRLKEILAAAQEALRSSWGHMAERLNEQLRETLAKEHRSLLLRSVETHIERILLEGRHLQKRTVLGQPWIRGLISLADGQAPLPVYLPAAPVRELPALQRFPARLIVEVRAQLDQYEASPIGLRAVALGRMISPSARR